MLQANDISQVCKRNKASKSSHNIHVGWTPLAHEWIKLNTYESALGNMGKTKGTRGGGGGG